MNYKVVFNHPALKRHFEKDLSGISSNVIQDEIMDAVMNLSHDPRPHGVTKIKPPVNIYNLVAQYRIRVGNYRILYDIDEARKIVSVIALRKRDEGTYRS